MHDLRQQIAAVGAQRSLILAYSIDLAYFEARILESLQANGEGRVVLLSDSRDHAAAMSQSWILQHAGLALRRPRPHRVHDLAYGPNHDIRPVNLDEVRSIVHKLVPTPARP
jgi:hypothetical protein